MRNSFWIEWTDDEWPLVKSFTCRTCDDVVPFSPPQSIHEASEAIAQHGKRCTSTVEVR